MSEYRSIREFDPSGSRVLVRVDFNVPLDENGHVTDDRRIQGALPTIRAILDGGGSVILMSHLGRPKGEGHEPALSMGPVADRLSELLGRPVVIPGPLPTSVEAVAAAGELQPGEVVLLENLRFEKGEKKGDPEFASILAGMADAYCTDAFGTAHRADASMVAVPEAMGSRPKLLGCLMAKEVEYLGLRLADARKLVVSWPFWEGPKSPTRSPRFEIWRAKSTPCWWVGRWRTRCSLRVGARLVRAAAKRTSWKRAATCWRRPS